MTDTTIDLDKLAGITLDQGCHDGPDDGFCLMEAVAYFTGARDALRPTIEELQRSAIALFTSMIDPEQVQA